MEQVVILTGSGISAESGIKTFREAGGLWEGHDVMEVASPIGWRKNPELVLDFYNQRREQLKKVVPNAAHYALAELEKHTNVTIITQNVDDLHERAGSSIVLHLHGELNKVRSTLDASLIYEWEKPLYMGDLCEKKSQLRPHIVWFGEEVPLLEKAIDITETATIFIIIGTSMQVYPAASLLNYTKPNTPIFFIDPHPTIQQTEKIHIIAEKASSGVPTLITQLISELK